MIYMISADAEKPVLFMFLLPDDLQTIKEGRTLFVDPRGMQGRKIDTVVVAFAKSKSEVSEMLKLSGFKGELDQPLHNKIITHEPHDDEMKCSTCDMITKTYLLFEGRCTVCWATECKKLRAMSN